MFRCLPRVEYAVIEDQTDDNFGQDEDDDDDNGDHVREILTGLEGHASVVNMHLEVPNRFYQSILPALHILPQLKTISLTKDTDRIPMKQLRPFRLEAAQALACVIRNVIFMMQWSWPKH